MGPPPAKQNAWNPETQRPPEGTAGAASTSMSETAPCDSENFPELTPTPKAGPPVKSIPPGKQIANAKPGPPPPKMSPKGQIPAKGAPPGVKAQEDGKPHNEKF